MKLLPGTYVINGAPQTWEQRVAAALLAPNGAVASHLTAATLWKLIDDCPERIHVMVRHGAANGRSTSVCVHRAKSLGRSDVRVVAGMRVTCPARTLVDLAGILSPDRLEAAVDEALHLGLTSVAATRRYVRERGLGSRPGVGTLRRVLRDREAGALQKELERKFLRIIRKYRLPRPVRQHPAGVRRKIDFAYPEVMVAIELDGWDKHGTPHALTSDDRRQNEIVLEGWRILRFTWKDVTGHPDQVAADIRSALRMA